MSAPRSPVHDATAGDLSDLSDLGDGEITARRVRDVQSVDAPTRERWAEAIAARLDRPMAALGLLFLFVVLGQTVSDSASLQRSLAAVAWLLWAVFVGEFALRWYVAPVRLRFLRRNWWQLVFLAVPFLRFLRLVALLRVARAGRVVSSAVRSSRSAGRLLGSRLSWVAAVSAIVVLASSQLLYAFGLYPRYGDALHAAALATVSGQPLGLEDGLAKVLEILLAIYSVVVFAAVAGTLGAYFVQDRDQQDRTGERRA